VNHIQIDTLSQKRHLLKVMSSGEWYGSMDLVQMVGIAWNQRKNELRREEGILFEKRASGRAFEYRLRTPVEQINLTNCELIEPGLKGEQTMLAIGSRIKSEDGDYVVEAVGINGKFYVRGPKGLTIMSSETLTKIGLPTN